MKKKDSFTFKDGWVAEQIFELKLFITGASPNSARAIANLKTFCEEHADYQYNLEIIDVYQQPLKASNEDIIALPMLVKYSPLPMRRLIGDMSDTEKMLKGLGLNR